MPASTFMLELLRCIVIACAILFTACIAVATIIATVRRLKKGGRKNGD